MNRPHAYSTEGGQGQEPRCPYTVRSPVLDDLATHKPLYTYPFNPVSVTPSIKYFWPRKKTMMTGIITTRPAAIR